MRKSSFRCICRRVFNRLNKSGCLNWVPSNVFLTLKYYIIFGKKLNLHNPKTYSEKLQWLKLYDHDERYPLLVDKFEVKTIIADILGEECIIPTLGVWDNFDEIDFNKLPTQFVLKCTHDSGGLIICTNKSKLDKEKAKDKIESCLNKNYFWSGREWPYLKIKPRIIAEKYMEDDSGQLYDYKVFVFEGKAYCIQVDFDRFTNHKRNFYDINWNYIPFTTRYPTDPNHFIEKPSCLELLIEKAENISQSLNNPHFVRTDFYIINGKIFFGEITFYHGSGFEEFYPEEYDIKLGNLIKL